MSMTASIIIGQLIAASYPGIGTHVMPAREPAIVRTLEYHATPGMHPRLVQYCVPPENDYATNLFCRTQ